MNNANNHQTIQHVRVICHPFSHGTSFRPNTTQKTKTKTKNNNNKKKGCKTFGSQFATLVPVDLYSVDAHVHLLG
jgi:hypothetical protein